MERRQQLIEEENVRLRGDNERLREELRYLRMGGTIGPANGGSYGGAAPLVTAGANASGGSASGGKAGRGRAAPAGGASDDDADAAPVAKRARGASGTGSRRGEAALEVTKSDSSTHTAGHK